MFHEEPQHIVRKPKPKSARPHDQRQDQTDAIVWAAYRKFGKSGSVREAVNQCLAEDRADAKRRVQP